MHIAAFLFALVAFTGDSACVDPHADLFDAEGAPFGCEALARHDSRELGGDDDGFITESDAIWPRLRIWRDLDGDGVAAHGELLPLSGAGVRALAVRSRSAGRVARVDVP